VTSRETAELQTQLHKLLEYYENKLEEVSERNNAFEVRDKTGRNEPYSVELRELVMRLQSRNVADGQICDVITDVCTMFGLNIRAEDLPSERSLRRFAQEHGALASVQIAREISLPGNQGALGLAHDGTQLGQDKLIGNTLVGRQSSLCLGVTPIYANTAQGQLDGLVSTLDTITKTAALLDPNIGVTIQDILSRIRVALNDKAASEGAYNNLIAEAQTLITRAAQPGIHVPDQVILHCHCFLHHMSGCAEACKPCIRRVMKWLTGKNAPVSRGFFT
jgi:hypothetical protein